jgi:hypothetical protein
VFARRKPERDRSTDAPGCARHQDNLAFHEPCSLIQVLRGAGYRIPAASQGVICRLF